MMPGHRGKCTEEDKREKREKTERKEGGIREKKG